MKIPKAFQSKQAELLATKLPFIHIEPFATDEALEPWASKYRGLPYLPKDAPYPQGTSGRPLAFLAQINFSEVPKLEGYPTSGILQFFIADGMTSEHGYGLETANPYSESNQFQLQQQQNNFRVVYYPEFVQNLDSLKTSLDFLPDFDWVPVMRQCRLEFSLKEEFVGLTDYRFTRLFGKDFFRLLSDKDWEELGEFDLIESQGNKIGGYACFTQEDIRELAPPNQNWLLLLQIDSADHTDIIMWGDSGIGNFFIEEKALKALDFSKVLYNWDCC